MGQVKGPLNIILLTAQRRSELGLGEKYYLVK